MPTYEYVCASCNNAWEELQKISEPAVTVCPKCEQSTAKRQISGGTFILKGGGWYADLYSSTKPAAETKSDGKSTTPAATAAPTGGAEKAAAAPAATPAAAPAASSSSGSGTSST
jgi:putative FmdB family regulatory protein